MNSSRRGAATKEAATSFRGRTALGGHHKHRQREAHIGRKKPAEVEQTSRHLFFTPDHLTEGYDFELRLWKLQKRVIVLPWDWKGHKFDVHLLILPLAQPLLSHLTGVTGFPRVQALLRRLKQSKDASSANCVLPALVPGSPSSPQLEAQAMAESSGTKCLILTSEKPSSELRPACLVCSVPSFLCHQGAAGVSLNKHPTSARVCSY